MIWLFGRAIIYLKRMAAAADRIADAQEQQASVAYQSFNLAHPARRPIRKAEFGVADIEEDWNKRWAAQQEGAE